MIQSKGARRAGQWRELRALVRGPLESYMRKNRRAARAPPGPQHITFLGLGKGDAGAQGSVKGLPSPRRLWLLPRRETVNPSAGPSVGTYRTTSNAGANNKARSAAASDGACRGVSVAGALSSNRRGEPVDVRGPSHTILIDAPWPQSWFNRPGMHHLGCTKSASTPRSAH